MKVEKSINPSLDVKETFGQCGTCSQTFAKLLNHEFGISEPEVEYAADPLAGGISNQGHQCGMLWGSALAIGAEAYRRFENEDQALAAAVSASQAIIHSFQNRSKTVNCKEIIGYDLTSVIGLVQFMFKAFRKGMKNSQCFNLADEWAPEAIEASKEGLDNKNIVLDGKPISCASEVVKRLGGSDREAMLVAGFAGGLGLSGNACGALAAAIWYHNLIWCRENKGKRPSLFNNRVAKKLLTAFKAETNSCMECSKITNCEFTDINEHSNFIRAGGCEHLIEMLSKK